MPMRHPGAAPVQSAADAAQAAQRALRSALGRFPTGVTVITTRDAHGELAGLTANSFSSLSLAPPLIVWSLRLASSNISRFADQQRFVVNVLAPAQIAISRLFASAAPDKFDQLEYDENAHGVPMVRDCAAWFECRQISHQSAGDHCLFIAEVERFTHSDAPPLLFHGGVYVALGERL